MDDTQNKSINNEQVTESSNSVDVSGSMPDTMNATQATRSQRDISPAVAGVPPLNQNADDTYPGQQLTSQFDTAIPADKSVIDDMPAIKNWQPAPSFSALGVLVGALFWITLALFVGPLLAWIIQTVVLAIYAIVFYRSYFTENPRITSSKVISFLNYAVSFSSNVVSAAIGWCWNRNLRTSHDTKTPKMGISYIVAIVYFCLMIALLFWYESIPHLVRNSDGSYSYVNQPTEQNASKPQTSQGETSNEDGNTESYQTSIPSTNSRIAVPAGWDAQLYRQDDGSSYEALMLYPSYAGKDTVAFVVAWDVSEFLTDEYMEQYGDKLSINTVNENVVLERNRMNMDTVENETASLVEINGIDYWKAVTEGSYSGLPMKDTSYYCFANSTMYQYTLSCLGDSDISNGNLAADFDSIVASASYK